MFAYTTTTRAQGDLGELSAIAWFVEQGAQVFLPFGHSPDCDLVADWGRGPKRIQVKTCTRVVGGRYVVMLATKGGNQSWSGTVKRFAGDRCDELFVLTGDGRRWLIPAAEVEGGTEIRLGGPKYARYEIEAGRPLAPAGGGRSLESLAARRDTEAVKRA